MKLSNGTSAIAIAALLIASCGGGGGGGSTTPQPPTPSPPAPPTQLYSVPAQLALTSTQVEQIIAQAVHEAQARGIGATIAVVDRLGNVLAVFAMNNANLALRVPDSPGGTATNTGLQGVSLPAPAAAAGAIAKAVTGAYLSSSGHAFSTRTASMIVQEHFPPSAVARGLESGPLYGVQFSSLPCSDLVARFDPAGGSTYRNALTGVQTPSAGRIGPQRTPLGLSADSGGFPLYINGVVVGGVGVMTDGVYGFDPEVRDIDHENDEAVALAATHGFEAPAEIRAERVSVDGTTLRYTDVEASDLVATGAPQPFVAINGPIGVLATVPGYYAGGSARPGTAYGAEASGIRASTPVEFSNRDAFVLSDGSGNNRFPIRGGTEGSSASLTATEVRTVLERAFLVMSAARGQIRRPLDSRAQVSISMVDTNGAVLGVVRSPDAPIFGIDVSLQKARTAMFFSAAFAAAQLSGDPDARVAPTVGAYRNFFGDPNGLTGQFAITARAVGNISRPYFPDGQLGQPPGPFSPPIQGFNPFSTGLQSDLIVNNVVQHVGFVLTGVPPDTASQCTNIPNRNLLANGIQIFPGSVPIYRGDTLVGAIGVSGDGIDQDDMIGFLGTHNAGIQLGGSIGNAPLGRRSDRIEAHTGNTTTRLRYVVCPFSPFIGTNEQNVCDGK